MHNFLYLQTLAVGGCLLFAQAHTAEVSPWAQFGILGAVVGSLFGVVMYLLNGHKTERKEQDDLHRSERGEWRQSEEKRSERMEGVVKELTDAIRNK